MNIEIRHLRDFVAVAQEASFTAAAQRVHVAQQVLSAQVRQLVRLRAEDHQNIRGRVRWCSHNCLVVVSLRRWVQRRMNRSTALAKPSSSLDVVTRRAAFWTSWLALPMAMLSPEWANMSTSLGWSPIVAISCGGIS